MVILIGSSQMGVISNPDNCCFLAQDPRLFQGLTWSSEFEEKLLSFSLHQRNNVFPGPSSPVISLCAQQGGARLLFLYPHPAHSKCAYIY